MVEVVSGLGAGSLRPPAAGPDGSIHVGDTGNGRGRRFSSAGSGQGQFQQPSSVAVDGAGFGYVTDMGLHRVQVFQGDGTFVSMFGSTGSGPGQFSGAAAIEFDPDGRLIVLDKGNPRAQIFAALPTPTTRASWARGKRRWR